MDLGLSNKTVLVTGGAKGIGSGISRAFALEDANVVVNFRSDPAQAAAFAAELDTLGKGKIITVQGDVSREADAHRVFSEAAAAFSRVDVLVNNAGILPKFKRFDRYSDEEIERAININFYSCVYSVKTFLPMLLQSTDPGIVNIDSSAALMSLAGTSMYSASKAALKGFTEALREEFRGKCYVGLVCPGFTKTDIFRGQSNAGGKGEKVINMISTDCDLMVKMIMFGIEHKQALQIHGVDAHAMSVFGKLLPVNGSRLFSAVMKAADIDLFKEVFKDDAELAE